jgi:hypothetical protein
MAIAGKNYQMAPKPTAPMSPKAGTMTTTLLKPELWNGVD